MSFNPHWPKPAKAINDHSPQVYIAVPPRYDRLLWADDVIQMLHKGRNVTLVGPRWQWWRE